MSTGTPPSSSEEPGEGGTGAPSEKPRAKAKARQRLRLSRDVVLLTAGLAGIAHETIVYPGERPSLLILFAAMCGLPALLRKNGL